MKLSTFGVVGGAVAVLLAAGPRGAGAQSQGGLDRCMGKERTAQSIIDSCTAPIRAKVFTRNIRKRLTTGA